MELNSIAFPALGTGFAKFDPKEVAVIMAKVLTEQLHALSKPLDVEVVLHADSLKENLDFVDFFRQFDNASGWVQHVIRDHVVIFVHGIRTEAAWFSEAERIFRSHDHTLNPVAAGFGFFDFPRFLMPFEFAKRSALRRVESKIRIVSADPTTTRVSVIAHSFGTHLVGQVLKRNPDIRLHRLILCGAVLTQDFDWQSVREQLPPIDSAEYPLQRVVNDCGWRDIWPIFAHASTWGYGSSGRFGFQSPLVVDRYHDRSHSEFFDEEFVCNYWCNFISKGEVAISPEKRPPTSWLLQVITVLKLPYIVLAAFVIYVASFAF
ncbi:hypothetical protein G5V57_05895 [Nordella sp. HKS 07]|uniref:hypothetical protein n=1 Tax=Nordella sp. HKS 07 TaxID=2712222 RepID=UPI0013E15CB6|nr:hypothetical protein [Nordella sp. HKS 07]QIG47305.1 hypothetical protein G5V57_05895 [Nordella sp. HKS 07]